MWEPRVRIPRIYFDEIYLRIIYLGQQSFHFHNNDVMKMTVIVDDARIRRKRIKMSSDSGRGHVLTFCYPYK